MILPPKEFWKIFKETEGALSCAESLAIMNIAAQAPEGLYAEYGTYKGKSALSALIGLPKGLFYLYEPDFDTNKIDKNEVMAILKPFSKKINHLYLCPEYSIDVISEYDDYSYVFVDSGSHQDGLPIQEAKLLEDRVISNGIIAWHDFKNQFCEPAEAAEYLVSTGKYEWIPIDWQPIFDYVKEHNLEEGNNSWHQYPDLGHPPNFVGAVRRK